MSSNEAQITDDMIERPGEPERLDGVFVVGLGSPQTTQVFDVGTNRRIGGITQMRWEMSDPDELPVLWIYAIDLDRLDEEAGPEQDFHRAVYKCPNPTILSAHPDNVKGALELYERALLPHLDLSDEHSNEDSEKESPLPEED